MCSLRIKPMALPLRVLFNQELSVNIKQHVMWCIWNEDFALFLSMIMFLSRLRQKLKSVLSLYYSHHLNFTYCTMLSNCFWCLWHEKHLLTSFCVGDSTLHFTSSSDTKSVHSLKSHQAIITSMFWTDVHVTLRRDRVFWR